MHLVQHLPCQKTYPFFDRIHELYGQSDLAITRSGANTLFECALFQLPAIVIPYPFAGGHQAGNAMQFAKKGGILFREESEVTADWLLETIRSLRGDEKLRQKMSEALKEFSSPEAADRLVDLSEDLLGQKR